MEINISYDLLTEYENCCFAKAELPVVGKVVTGCGKTWEAAKKHLLEEIAVILRRIEFGPPPAPEKVAI